MNVELYDSDMIKIDEGPVAWMAAKQGTAMNMEAFRRGAEDQFRQIGLDARVNCYETDEPGTYAFEVEIRGRLEEHVFDYDRMVHEVTNNLLDDPDQEKGFISTVAAEREFRFANPERRGPNHGHGPGNC